MPLRLIEAGVPGRQGPHEYPRIYEEHEHAHAAALRLLTELPDHRRPSTVRIVDAYSRRTVETVRPPDEDLILGGPFDDTLR